MDSGVAFDMFNGSRTNSRRLLESSLNLGADDMGLAPDPP